MCVCGEVGKGSETGQVELTHPVSVWTLLCHSETGKGAGGGKSTNRSRSCTNHVVDFG